MKTSLEWLNSRFKPIEERINKVEGSPIEIMQSKEQKEKEYRIMNRSSGKWVDQHMLNKSTRGRGDKKSKNVFENVMAVNFPNLMKKFIYIFRNLNILHRINSKRSIPRYVVNVEILRENFEVGIDKYTKNPSKVKLLIRHSRG